MSVKPHYPFRIIIFFIGVLLLCQSSFAQPKADFSALNVSGCAPIVVHFTDNSTGNPTQWRWDLGNGVISNLQNPSSTYFNPGTYNVKLVVRNASGADSLIKNNFITVNPNPVVNFKASDTTGCYPLHVQFSDLSTTAGGTITDWNWDFGDGSISSGPNPSHTYISAGNFTVTLRVTNSFGCIKTFSKNQYIKTAEGVKAGFTNNSPGICRPPVLINFTNATNGPGSITYTWNFGDGTISTLQNPSHSYNSPGTYSVKLVATSSQGCTDTVLKENLISIGTVTSQFNSPPDVCEGQYFIITNTSDPAPGSVSWNFGDGTFSTDINPVKKYTTPGNYTIKLVNNFGGCIDSTSKNILVKPKPKTAFNANKINACKAPAVISFINQSTGASSYQWLFGDGTSSNLSNPAHTYTATGTYTVTLISVNTNGCSDTLTKDQFINIQEPVITVANLPASGCVPVTIAPVPTVTSSEPVASYLWSFGDGTTSISQNPVHTYTTAGTYTITLTIITTGGCSQTLIISEAVKTGTKPSTNFVVNPTNVCAFQSVAFTDKTSGGADQWLWDFGDGTTSNQQNPKHEFQDTGYFNVQLITWNNICPDTLKLDKIVYVKPPIAAFTYTRNCNEKYRINFVDKSLGAITYQWFFGDGTSSTQINPVHDYAVSGTYEVILNVKNDTCTNTTRQTIQIVNEKADFIIDKPIICKGLAVSFKTKNINAINIASFEWDFGNGTGATNTENPSINYEAAGIYNVTLTITDILGCTDTKTLPVTVYGPSANFDPTSFGACLGTTNVNFTDRSTTDGTNQLIKWIWNYGDGNVDSSGVTPFTHYYPNAGEYDIKLTVVDKYGCRDSITKPRAITIAQPVAAFNTLDTLSCTGKTIQFNNTSTGYDLQSVWTFGDGTSDIIFNPNHVYSDTGIYDIKLVVTDRYGCKDSMAKDAYVTIGFPKAGFTLSDSISSCPPLNVDFTNTSTNYESLYWDFGDGNSSIIANPSHYYTQPGIYYATLTATSAGGCTDVYKRMIEVRGPRGTFTYQPPIGCNPHTVTFTASTLDRLSFIWDFSDGNTNSTTDSTVTHTYITAGDYIPKMILVDANGCTVPITGTDTIHILEVAANFTIDKFAICDSGKVNFNSTAVSNDLISSYQWNFGDGTTSNLQNPSHQFSIGGSYDIQLTVTTLNGCTDSLTLNDTIHVYESPIINMNSDSAACLPASVNFIGTVVKGNASDLQWNWTFGNGQASILQNPSTQLYSIAKDYLVTSKVTDSRGCTDEKIKTFTVHPLPVIDAGAGSIVCIGDSLKLNATGGTSYTWSPSSDLSCLNCPSPTTKPAETAIYNVTGYNQFGCDSRDTVLIKVRKHNPLMVAAGDSICVGGSVRLSASGADKYSWSPSNGLDNSAIANPVVKPTLSTTYQLIATDNDNCFADTALVYIHVTALPTVNAGPDNTIAVGSSIQLKPVYSNDVISWKWTPANSLDCYLCPAPVASPKENTKYTIEVRNSMGCINLDEVSLFVLCEKGNLFIPNTFSPNGDGKNDVFYPRGSGIATIRSLRVFDRWGELVYEKLNFNANDISAGWDGTFKGKILSPDVYVYACVIACENNQLMTFKGDVTLLQ